MDAIESMDWGAYAHFRFLSQQNPMFLEFVKTVNVLGNDLCGVLIPFLGAIFGLAAQRRTRAVLVTALSFFSAIGLLGATHFLVPRRRPPDAENFLGPNGLLDSYPSDAVFLTMLTLVLLGFALWKPLDRPWQRVLYIVIAILTTVWICLSQLFLSVHFVTDVIGAIVGAALFGWIACRLMVDAAPSPA